MLKRYSRGYDLPPLMRDSLLADDGAAACFNALPETAQQSVVSSCAGMSSREQIDEFIRQTENFMVTDICCRSFNETDPTFL